MSELKWKRNEWILQAEFRNRTDQDVRNIEVNTNDNDGEIISKYFRVSINVLYTYIGICR